MRKRERENNKKFIENMRRKRVKIKIIVITTKLSIFNFSMHFHT